MSTKSQLQRWQKAGVIDTAITERILAYENSKQGFRFGTLMFGLGALAIVLGFAAIISSNWDVIPAALKLSVHAAINLVLAYGVWHSEKTNKPVAREILLFVLAGFTLTFIALIGQIYQTGAPLWAALTLWMIIISPFLFAMARTKFTVICWILAFWFTMGSATEIIVQYLSPLNLTGPFFTSIPFAIIAIGQSRRLQKTWPVWPNILASFAYFSIVWWVSLAQIAWSENSSSFFRMEILPHVVPAFFTGLLGTAALYALRNARLKNPKPEITDIFIFVSVIVGFAPMLITHTQWPIIGAIIFMLYWALVGWTGIKMGHREILNASVVIIAARLVGVYIEVFGSLLSTGIGLMTSGVLLIGLVAGTRKIMQKLGKAA